MAEKTVLSDASPLIGLAAAGGFELLRGLFGVLAVTATVRREVAAGKAMPGAGELSQAIRQGWIRTLRDARIDPRLAHLDRGEATTLSAALARAGRCLVLLDDPAARRAARELGIAVTGTAGVLLVAKRRGAGERRAAVLRDAGGDFGFPALRRSSARRARGSRRGLGRGQSPIARAAWAHPLSHRRP